MEQAECEATREEGAEIQQKLGGSYNNSEGC